MSHVSSSGSAAATEVRKACWLDLYTWSHLPKTRCSRARKGCAGPFVIANKWHALCGIWEQPTYPVNRGRLIERARKEG